MQLMRELDVPAKNNARVYRYALWTAVLVYVLLLGLAAGMFDIGVRKHVFFMKFVGALFGCFVFLGRRFLLARFRASNWLVRTDENGVYLKFRSYLNYHFPSDDLTVVFIPYREIRTAHRTRERRQTGMVGNDNRSVQVVTLVEMEPTCDVAELRSIVREENTRPGPKEKRWYGSSSSRANHSPLVVDEHGRLRILWECTPSAASFLTELAPHATVDRSTWIAAA
jgi:hypothetical protein